MKRRALFAAAVAFAAIVVTPGSAVSLVRHSEVIHEYRNTLTGCPHAATASSAEQSESPRDGAHDFDLNLGTWHTHIRRLTHPLANSNDWFEVEGSVRIRPVWNGKAQLEEIEADGPKGHWESMTLFLYNPTAHQWTLHFVNSNDGTVSDPATGEFHEGRGEFYAPDTFKGRAILTRQIWSKITPDSHQFEQAFSTDGGKTWETNFIANLTRADDATAAQHIAPAPDANTSHDFDFALGTWKEKTSRMLHPLTGSTEWIEMNGQSVTRTFWNGRANYTELESDGGPSGHLELLALRLYNPESKQWNVFFATSGVGVLGMPPVTGSFTGTRGEFFGGDTLNGRAILIRFTFTNLGPATMRSEQAFSSDGGKTWETNWINNYSRIPDAPASAASAHN